MKKKKTTKMLVSFTLLLSLLQFTYMIYANVL